MMKITIQTIAVLVALSSAAGGQTRPNCAPRDVVVTYLGDTYGETRQSLGLGANNVIVEIFASQTSGSWTITATSTSGITCLVASGQAFEKLADVLPAAGDDA